MAGLLVATFAVMLPSSLLALVAGRCMTRRSRSAWLGIAKDGLIPVALGLMLASGMVTARAIEPDLLAVAVSVATAALVALPGSIRFG